MEIELGLELETEDDIRDILSEQLPENYDDSHFLYMIECRRRYKGSKQSMESNRDIRQRAESLKKYDDLPWLDTCLDAHTLIYVGETSDVAKRLYQHMWEHWENGNAALFTKLFPPHLLRDLRVFPNRSAAELEEKHIRRVINEQLQNEKAFAYSDVGDNENWVSFFD